jgi:hypothetical protein
MCRFTCGCEWDGQGLSAWMSAQHTSRNEWS